MNSELFKAILAMDAYNRGYGAGIDLGQNSDAIGIKIGNATVSKNSGVLTASDGTTRLDIPAGFYAIAYTLGGQKIISYRGTNADSIVNFAIDAFYGYGIGAGANSATQGNLAIDFYKAVAAAQSVAPHDANIVLTGHSLGGGLAGYIGGLYGKDVSIFDNMTYENSVNGAFTVASNPTAYATLIHPMTGMPYIDSGRLAFAQSLSNNIYGGATPWDPVFTGIAWYVEGELLDNLLPARDSQYLSPVFINSYGGTRNSIALHDMALLVTLRYAEINYGITIADWHAVGEEFINSLFNDTLAAAAGFDSLGGVFGDAQKMRNAIAYSAITEGTRPFGDAAIRAMFNDANELGKVFGATGSSAIIAHYADSISNIFTQFAGHLAINGVLAGAGDPLLNGVLALSNNDGQLDIDFSNPLWAATSDIVGRTTLFNNIFIGSYSADANISSAMQQLWGSSNSNTIFDHVTLATKETGGTFTLSDAPAAGKADLFVGSLGVDIVIGSSGNDALLGYAGNDTLSGGSGDDIINGGADFDIVKYDTTTNVKIYENFNVQYSLAVESDIIQNIELISGSSSSDQFDITLSASSSVQEINTGGGVDTVTVNGSYGILDIVLGDGADILKAAPSGSTVYGGDGDDSFFLEGGGIYNIADGESSDNIMVSKKDALGVTIDVAVSGTVKPVGNGLYELNDVYFLQEGNDLTTVSGTTISGATIKDFFRMNVDASGFPVPTPGFDALGNWDGSADYTFMGGCHPALVAGSGAKTNDRTCDSSPAIRRGDSNKCGVMGQAENDNNISPLLKAA